MGVFDSLIPQAQTPSSADVKLLCGLIDHLAREPHGEGMRSLQADFHRNKLDAQLVSWMGNNPAEPLSREQLSAAISDENRILTETTVADLQHRAGLDRTQTLEHIAQLVPALVRALTPRGEVPSQTVVQIGLESLRRELAR